MKNADKPAMPANTAPYEVPNTGMTKREHFAGLAMQATRAANPKMPSCECAAMAVNDADSLLAALEGTQS